ncbi:MAG: carbohydrate kinase family protein [Gemmatimonadota bacterium]
MPHLTVVGGASLDLLHFAGRSERSCGGAGLYTALAAARAGTEVTMVGPRPDPMPEELKAAAEVLDWRGPTVDSSDLPHFEIEHFPDGETIYHEAIWGSEALLRPEQLPAGFPRDWVYIVPMLEPELNVEFTRSFQGQDVIVACGTYGGATTRSPESVFVSMAAADIFFCNEPEAEALFGSLDQVRVEPGKLAFVTLGPRGALVVQGEAVTEVRGVPVRALDPTGAGDTFCGTVLARLAAGDHPVEAARRGVAAAADLVIGVGPERLLRPGPAPEYPADPRAAVDEERTAAVAEVLRDAPGVQEFAFTGDSYPDEDDPGCLDFFFAAALQQFGFWTEADGRYEQPLIATLGGNELKGSDFLWAAYGRWLRDAPEELTPAGHASLEADVFGRRYAADDGCQSMPALDLHFRQARDYGRDMSALGWTPASIVAQANDEALPLAAFLSLLDRVGGYKDDPLRKKSVLLAIILMQRPERFLRSAPGEQTPPIVDYHLQRSCLRTGLVRALDPRLQSRLESRAVVTLDEEEAVRRASYAAAERVCEISGRTMGAVDWFFFQNRSRCPEMTEPYCAACPLDGVCSHEIGLFQPVHRTTYY